MLLELAKRISNLIPEALVRNCTKKFKGQKYLADMYDELYKCYAEF